MTDKIIKSNRGNDKMAYNGYFYNYTHTNMGIKYWRCNNRGCTSILKTNIRNELRDNGMHNHLTDKVKYYRTLLKQKMKTRALSSTESNRNVVLEVLKENVDVKYL
ncbi:hypothetical protein NGRA_1539 [Nosema granulosis]|uniref:FLYWCH-type domain-containing protein n=1 Tax=Nosema granulosis TaxID=83296 RepID=A0A9P6KZ21_9MICR|nr:hypothetical protein NGRA_1539 [Nosema granulosis]